MARFPEGSMRRVGGGVLAVVATVAACAAAVGAPATARAYDNDLVLSKLGAPQDLRAGPAETDKIAKDPFAQERFARFVGEFALALMPLPAGLPSSVGDAGFEFVFSLDTAQIRRSQVFTDGQTREVWPTEAAGGGTLVLPTLALRKGLPFGFEVGTSFGYVTLSSMVAVTAQLKWALVEGIHLVPDLAVRAFGGTVLGTGALGIAMGGWDVGIGERFAPGGGAEWTLYGGLQRLGLNATTNNIDFDPTKEDTNNPTTDDSVFRELGFGPVYNPSTSFWRAYAGAQARVGLLVTGLEVANAWGDNPIYTAPAGTSPADNPSVSASLWKVALRLGVSF
jgi:hypothetical protein